MPRPRLPLLAVAVLALLLVPDAPPTLGGSPAQAAGPPSPSAPAAPAAADAASRALLAAAGLSGIELLPYFSAPAVAAQGREALGALRDGRFADATLRFEALAQLATGADREAAQLLSAICLTESLAPAASGALVAAGDPARVATAVDRLDEVSRRPGHLLADHARFYAARADLYRGRAAPALARARLLVKHATLGPAAILLAAEASAELNALAEAESFYRSYLGSQDPTIAPGGIGHAPPPVLARSRYRLALVLERAGRKAEAARELREALVSAPTAPFARDAEARWRSDGGETAAPLEPAFQLRRARSLFDLQRNRDAEQAFDEVLKSLPAGASAGQKALSCVAAYHRAQSVFKQRQRARAYPLYTDAVARCQAAAPAETDLLVKALYGAGRTAWNRGDHKNALAHLAALEKDHPRHSYADDARMRAAEIQRDRRQHAEADALLAAIPDLYPGGDMVAEALWRLAFAAYGRGDLAGALKWLDAGLKKVPRERDYFAEGRGHYWRGRVLERLGRKEPARESYAQAVQRYPLSYYALLAMMRLRAGWPVEAARLAAAAVKAPTTGAAEPAGAAAAPLDLTPAVRRGIELLRLGLWLRARAELDSAGLKVGKGTPTDRMWLLALLFDRAQRWDLSIQVPRRLGGGFRQSYPTESAESSWAFWRWRLAYPRAYEELVVEAAGKNALPPALLWAIAREESAFDPRAESFANAVGLAQLILPTARRFGDGLDISRETLRDPRTNLTVSGRFLGFLSQHWKGHPALMVPSYNAGEAATRRWVKAFGRLPIDELVENIPYDETRRYTKRVLSTYGTYHYLYARASTPLDRFVSWRLTSR